MALSELYSVLQLRSEVFNVEQRCTDNDLDRRDLDSATTHYWVADNDEAVSYLRVLAGDAPNDRWIGRVCTAQSFRGRGLSAALMRKAIEDHGENRLLLHGQTYLIDWYRSFGFEVHGEEFEQAGLPHLEMIRSAT